MAINIGLILVIATLVMGAVLLLDKLFFARRRTGKMPLVVDLSRSVFPVVLIVLVVRSFLGEPFRIPSGSMMPTLLVGDFILVNKFSYGLRLPVTHTKILDTGSPSRGDVAVFRYPQTARQTSSSVLLLFRAIRSHIATKLFILMVSHSQLR